MNTEDKQLNKVAEKYIPDSLVVKVEARNSKGKLSHYDEMIFKCNVVEIISKILAQFQLDQKQAVSEAQETYVLTERKIIKILAAFLEQVEKGEVVRKGNIPEHTVREWLYGKDLLQSLQLEQKQGAEQDIIAMAEKGIFENKITEKEMLDWLETIMTDDDNYCEIFFAGLRNFTGKASAFQIESNPEKFKTVHAPTLREAIIVAMKEINTKQ